MNIDDAIAQLGQKMGVELSLDANRACRLVFDGTINVDFEAPAELPEQLVMSCVVATDAFPGGREAVLQSLLEANLFGRGTGGGVLALDAECDEILLQRSLVMTHTDLVDLVNALEQLLQHAEAWIERLRAAEGTASLAPKDSWNASASMMRI